MTKIKKQNANTRQNFPNTRKAVRKQKRLQKKAHRQEHYMKKKNPLETFKLLPGRYVKRPEESPETVTKAQNLKKKKLLSTPQDILSKERQKDINEAEKLKSQMEEQRKKILSHANEDEDKVIKKLEKQLGLNKCKNKKSYFADDGLDYLLEICDRATSEQIVAAEKHLADVQGESDFEEDLAVVTGKEVSSKKVKKKKKDDDSDEEQLNNDELDSVGSGEELSEGDNEEFDDDSDEGSIDEDDEMSAIKEGSAVCEDEPEEKSANPKKKHEDNKILEIKKNNHSKYTEKDDENRAGKERVIKENDLRKVFSDDEVSNLSGDDDMAKFSGDDSENEVDNKSNKNPDVWEDIYGRKRDKEGNVIKEEKGVYIPPHLRNKDSSSEKELVQLRRQIKSVLNKLAGTNLHWACTSVEGLYSNNSRNAVNTSLSQLWLDATVGPSHTPDRLVAEHAALVSVLHANVATEIGAHFLQELTKRFDEMMLTPQPMGDKTLDNLVNCLAHLYSFKIFHATLLYDIFGRLLHELTEKNIECVLVALRSVGGVLRKEEPLALKNFIHDTQTRVAQLNETAADGSRIKFLLEVLMAVKNNNLSKIPNYDPTYTEHLKKQTRGIIRRGNYVTPLNIRLEDLLKADERGKWWVVGSAWEGNARRDDNAAAVRPPATNDQKLLELARKQRMNTDVRKSIFCVIMSAEDYMDAFEKLQHLGLKGQQEREIIHVLLACCLQEKTFNPYYAVLGQKLCDVDRRHQLSIQYSTWDKIKELEQLPKYSATNLAQFLVHLILGKGLPLSILKVIQFSDLSKHSVRFMRQILLAIILNSNFQEALEVFDRISKPPKLNMFRESLRLFIQHFLLKNVGKGNVLSAEETAVLKDRVVEVNKILIMHESKLKF